VTETQLAVLQRDLDLPRVVLRSEKEIAERLALFVAERDVPGVECAAERRAGVAGCWLHPDVLELPGALQRRDEQRVQSQAAGETQVLALAGHADNGVLGGGLDAGGQVGAL